MIVPDDIAKTAITLEDQFFDLRGLSVYSSIGVSTLRDYINAGNLPCFRLKGKFLIKRSEFDKWVEGHRFNKKQDLNNIVDEVFESLKG